VGFAHLDAVESGMETSKNVLTRLLKNAPIVFEAGESFVMRSNASRGPQNRLDLKLEIGPVTKLIGKSTSKRVKI
jgi:hypothetical protein